MVGMLKRMRKLKELLDIRFGPGAAVISPNVKRIHMAFAKKADQGHMGPRKFWHECLPRLKYHNPSIPMTVARSEDQAGPATLTVYFGDKATEEAQETTRVIDMKGRHSTEILEDLMQMAQGEEVKPSQQEQEQIDELEQTARRAAGDRERMRKYVQARKREEEILEQARRSVAAQASG